MKNILKDATSVGSYKILAVFVAVPMVAVGLLSFVGFFFGLFAFEQKKIVGALIVMSFLCTIGTLGFCWWDIIRKICFGIHGSYYERQTFENHGYTLDRIVQGTLHPIEVVCDTMFPQYGQKRKILDFLLSVTVLPIALIVLFSGVLVMGVCIYYEYCQTKEEKT